MILQTTRMDVQNGQWLCTRFRDRSLHVHRLMMRGTPVSPVVADVRRVDLPAPTVYKRLLSDLRTGPFHEETGRQQLLNAHQIIASQWRLHFRKWTSKVLRSLALAIVPHPGRKVALDRYSCAR